MIKSGRTFHCNFCARCVEKFDHHCSFINNCLGYRNHKFFLAFIFSYLAYFITSTTSAAMSFSTHATDPFSFNTELDYAFRIGALAFNVTQLIPLFYQIKEQIRKLCKKSSKFEGVRSHRNPNAFSSLGSNLGGGGSNLGDSTIWRGHTMQRSFLTVVETNTGFWYNLKQTLRYKPSTQEELRAFLFSESERFSTFVVKYRKRKEKEGESKTREPPKGLGLPKDGKDSHYTY